MMTNAAKSDINAYITGFFTLEVIFEHSENTEIDKKRKKSLIISPSRNNSLLTL
jgi:hypothetical protein